MDTLPDETILHIFSFLPECFLFKTVSITSRRFHGLVYCHTAIKGMTNFLQSISIDGKKASWPLALNRAADVIAMAPAGTLKSFTLMDGTRTWKNLFQLWQKSQLLILNVSNTRGVVKNSAFSTWMLNDLIELNVSSTEIDDTFLGLLEIFCHQLQILNISNCQKVTPKGFVKANLTSLDVLNIYMCPLDADSVIHAIRVYNVIIICIKNVN